MTSEPEVLPRTGDLRGDLLLAMRRMADQFDGPYGEAVRGLVSETLSNPERTEAARARVTGTRNRLVVVALERAVKRGEIEREVLTPRVTTLTSVLLAHHFLTHGVPISDTVLAEILDEVVLPLLRIRT